MSKALDFLSAKIVETANGLAILVSGRIISIMSSDPNGDTIALVTALRAREARAVDTRTSEDIIEDFRDMGLPLRYDPACPFGRAW